MKRDPEQQCAAPVCLLCMGNHGPYHILHSHEGTGTREVKAHPSFSLLATAGIQQDTNKPNVSEDLVQFFTPVFCA